MFREQVNRLSLWFEQWNECEQTVALYSLLKRLSPQQARFCSLVLEQCIADCSELQQQEQRANNPGFVTGLLGEGTGCSLPVAPLLNHLLLLRPGNADAKACYLSLIPRVLGAAVETGVNIEAARQLLSYSLIHPAISTDDRRVLTQWLRHLEDRISNPAPNTGQGQQQQEQSNNWGDLAIHHNGHGGLFVDGQPRVRRSNSLTPPVSIPQAADLSSSQDDLCARPKPRSFSLSSEHAPLSPQSSLASSGSGSESHLDELRAQHAGGLTSDACGMKDVAAWLKSLRLHKYSWLFASMTYDEMLALTEDALEARGVTKGARHKIVLSIKKLRERSSTLSQLEMDVVKGGGLRAALEELRVILATPIKPVPLAAEQQTEGTTEQEDLPRQITKVLGKVVTQLLVGGQVDEEAVGLTHTLLERCLTHEAFGPHRSRISTWRQQLLQLWPPLGTLAPHDSQQRPTPPRKWSHPPFPNGLTSESLGRGRPLQAPASRFTQNGSCRPGQGSPPVLASSFPVGASSLFGSMHRSSGLTGDTTNSSASFFAKRPSLQDSLAEPLQSHLWMQRTRSAPPKPNQFCGLAAFGKVSPTNLPEQEPEINLRLESLCLSMTEHALGGTGIGEL